MLLISLSLTPVTRSSRNHTKKMKTRKERHEEQLKILWRMEIESVEGKLSYANGFSVDKKRIVSSTFFFKPREMCRIRGRKCSDFGFTRALKLVFRQPSLGLVILKDREDGLLTSDVGLLASDWLLNYGQKVYATTSFGAVIGGFFAGNVAYPCLEFDEIVSSEDDILCEFYVYENYNKFTKARGDRKLGYFFNSQNLELFDPKKVFFPKKTSGLLPIIQLNEFPMRPDMCGGPLYNDDLKIVGMLFPNSSPYSFAIHVKAIKEVLRLHDEFEQQKRESVRGPAQKRKLSGIDEDKYSRRKKQKKEGSQIHSSVQYTSATTQRNLKNFSEDHNLGLVKQVLSSMYKRNIQRPIQTYLTFSIEDIAKAVELSSPREAEMHVLQMIQYGEICAAINRKDGMVRFLEDPEQYKTCEMVEHIEFSIGRMTRLSKKLTTVDELISCDDLNNLLSVLNKSADVFNTCRLLSSSYPLAELHASHYSLCYPFFLEACTTGPISKEQAKNLVLPVAKIIIECDAAQIRLAPEKSISVCEKRFQNYVELLEAPMQGVTPLLAAFKKLQSSPEHLTTLHADFPQLFLLTKCYKTGFRVLEGDIFKVDQPKGLYRYCYYGGMICIGLKRYPKALELLHNVLTASMSSLSAITVEAYKKYILVSLIHLGQFSISFPKYTAATAQRGLKNFSQLYIELVSCYGSGKVSELELFIQTNKGKIGSDHNLGLAKQDLSSMYKQNIQRPIQTYLTFSIEDIAKAVELSSSREAEMHVLQMIQDGEIYAAINQKDGMVRFLEDPEQYKTCEMIEWIDFSIQRMTRLSKKLTTVDELISCDDLNHLLSVLNKSADGVHQTFNILLADDFDSVPQTFNI